MAAHEVRFTDIKTHAICPAKDFVGAFEKVFGRVVLPIPLMPTLFSKSYAFFEVQGSRQTIAGNYSKRGDLYEVPPVKLSGEIIKGLLLGTSPEELLADRNAWGNLGSLSEP